MGRKPIDKAGAAGFFEMMLSDQELRAAAGYPSHDEIRRELHGKNLACWCPPPKPGQPDRCHAAVLLKMANAPRKELK